MGAWGVHSDECDNVYDFIGVGIQDRIQGGELPPGYKREVASVFNRSLRKEKDRETFAGAVRWGLRQGIRINANFLKATKRHLAKELAELKKGNNERGWVNPSARIRALKLELKEMDYALAHKGYGKKGKTYGILERMAIKLRKRPLNKRKNNKHRLRRKRK